MKKNKHAIEIANRFKELVEQSGDSLSDDHYDELALLIEAGIDTALVETLEGIADKLADMSVKIRHQAESFDE